MVEAEICFIPSSSQIVFLVLKCHKEPAILSKKYGLILSMPCPDYTPAQQDLGHPNRSIKERKTQRIYRADNLEVQLIYSVAKKKGEKNHHVTIKKLTETDR